MCINCGSIAILSVADIGKWYRKYHPGSDPIEFVPGICYECCQRIAVGDKIITRRFVTASVNIESDQRGTVRLIQKGREGNLYVIDLDNGHSRTCPRAAIRKPHDDELGKESIRKPKKKKPSPVDQKRLDARLAAFMKKHG